jgi:hypothetical protein
MPGFGKSGMSRMWRLKSIAGFVVVVVMRF